MAKKKFIFDVYVENKVAYDTYRVLADNAREAKAKAKKKFLKNICSMKGAKVSIEDKEINY